MLKRITLNLARTHEYPQGSIRHGYDIVAPLTGEGYLDIEEFNEKKDHCRVRRFWGDEPPRYGRLERRAGGVGGATWEIDYDDRSEDDDEDGYRLGDHKFALNEYISIKDDEGKMNTFQVVGIQNA